MVAIKTHQADAFLKGFDRPGATTPSAVLLYGTDAGLVAERALALAKRLAARENPPGEILRLDDTSLEDDPGRIAIELQTAPMFGGRKIVRATTGRRITAATLKPLVESGALEGFLIVEAGNLRPDDALRALFEKAPLAAAVACFPDEARDLEGMIREVLAGAKLQITPDARTLLVARLGADRGLSRAEVEKLALYALGKDTIEEGDVEAAVGDAAELALDRIVMAAASGRTAAAVSECDRSIAGGEDAQAVILALQRHFLRLHRTRSALDAGRTMDDALRQLKPAPHFKQKDAFARQCRDWSLVKLNAALAAIAETAKRARLASALDSVLAEHLLMDLGALAKGPAPQAARPLPPAS
ncbi:MAG TPA: DNA polymerase III subunit delta [Hyphomicrobiaceae bacterium]|nr:DNA polymerase III subunit delta [Hyphomicrobiaceae bacterium]